MAWSGGDRRVCVVAGTRVYGDGIEELEHVPEELALVRSALMEAGMEVCAEVSLDPSVPELKRAVQQAMRGGPDGAEPPYSVVVYYSGHGFVSEADYLLPLAGGHPGDRATVLSAYELAGLVFDSGPGPQEVVLVIDACQAGEAGSVVDEFGTKIERQRLEASSRVYVIASASPSQEAAQITFADAFAGAIRSPEVPPSQRYVSPQALAGYIQYRMGERGQEVQFVPPAGLPARYTSRSFPNPRYRRWDPTSLPEAAEGTGWKFCGRRRVVAEIVDHLVGEDPDGLPLLLVGSGGKGKTALLAWVTAAARGEPLPTAEEAMLRMVPPGCVDVFVDAKCADEAHELLRSIGQELGLPFTGDPEEFFARVKEAPGVKRILIDSVDEDPEEERELAELVLAPLAAIDSVRLVLTAARPIDGLAVRSVLLDSPDYFDPADIELLAQTILTERAGSLHRGASRDKVRRLGREVRDRAGNSFLHAYLFALDLAVREAEESETNVRTPVSRVFEDQLVRLNPKDPGWAADLLRPLALAFGSGVPNYPIWIDLVRRLSGRRVDREALDTLLREAHEFVTDFPQGRGSAGWRLRSGEFAAYLTHDHDLQAAHAAFSESLLAPLLREGGGEVEWSRADEYVRLNFAEHAVRARILDRFLTDPEFLLAVDPKRLRRALSLSGTPRARAVRDVCDVVHELSCGDGQDMSRLAFLAGAYGQEELAQRAKQRSRSWQPHWIDRCPAEEVAVVAGGGGRRFLVVTTQAGEVRAVEGGEGPLRSLTAGSEVVSAVAVGRMRGVPVALVGTWDGEARLYDVAGRRSYEVDVFDGRVVACALGDDDLLVSTAGEWCRYTLSSGLEARGDTGDVVVASVASAVVGGRRVVVGCSADRVAVWSAAGELVRVFTTPQRKSLTKVLVHAGRILTSSDDGTVWSFGLTGDDGRKLVDHRGHPVTSMRVVSMGQEAFLLTTGMDGTVVRCPLSGDVERVVPVVNVGVPTKAADVVGADELVVCTGLGTARIRLAPSWAGGRGGAGGPEGVDGSNGSG